MEPIQDVLGRWVQILWQPLDLVVVVAEAAATLATAARPITVVAPRRTPTHRRSGAAGSGAGERTGKRGEIRPGGGAVTVAAEQREGEDWAAVRVADQGPGIAPELLPQVFRRFVAGPATRDLGLGLYLAQQIVAGHGGTLTVDSILGAGTTFILALPGLPDPGTH